MKNRKHRQSAGVWARTLAAIERPWAMLAAKPDHPPRPKRRGYARTETLPPSYRACRQGGCRVQTAYGWCSAHITQERRGIAALRRAADRREQEEAA